MTINQKLNRILRFLSDNKDRINVNVNSVHQQIFESKISLNEAQQLFDKIKESGLVRVVGSEGRYIGWKIDIEEFLSQGGFEGNRNFRLELLNRLTHGQNNITSLVKEFIDRGTAGKMEVLGTLRELLEQKWVTIYPPDYGKLHFQGQLLDFDIHAKLTLTGEKEAPILLMGNALLNSSFKQANTGNTITDNERDLKDNIFLSYCWKDKAIADKIFTDLSQLGIKINKDDHSLKYKDRISDFMGSIRNSKFAILVISNDYLRSRNCMTEVLHILKEPDCFEKILPIIVDGTQLYQTKDMADCIKYWQQHANDIKASLDGLDIINSIEITEELKHVTFISQQIGAFMKELKDMLHIPLEQLVKQYYKPLLEKIGFADMSFAVELFRIANMEDVEERDIALDIYARSNPLNSYYYFLKGATAKLAGKFKLAKEHYSHAIEKDQTNAEAMNNLGFLLMEQFNDLPEAKKQFENAIKIQPDFTIARLNLGTVLSKIGEPEKAKEQYEYIIKFDAAEPRAYNNLANYYRSDLNDRSSIEKAESLLRKAIEIQPEFLDAYVNLGNLLKTTDRKEEGNSFYKKAKEMDLSGKSHAFFDMLIASEKG